MWMRSSALLTRFRVKCMRDTVKRYEVTVPTVDEKRQPTDLRYDHVDTRLSKVDTRSCIFYRSFIRLLSYQRNAKITLMNSCSLTRYSVRPKHTTQPSYAIFLHTPTSSLRRACSLTTQVTFAVPFFLFATIRPQVFVFVRG